MSLNASVGPFDTCRRCTPGSSVVTGAIASLPNAAFVYVRSMSALRSSAGRSVQKRDSKAKARSGYGRRRSAACSASVNRG